MYREVWVMGRCGVVRMVELGSHIRRWSIPGRRDVQVYRECSVQGGVVYREAWCTGRRGV